MMKAIFLVQHRQYTGVHAQAAMRRLCVTEDLTEETFQRKYRPEIDYFI